MTKIAVVIIMLSLVTTTVGAAECPDSKLMLAGTGTVCVARDKKGKCTETEQRLLAYCGGGFLALMIYIVTSWIRALKSRFRRRGNKHG
jgi:hypothetical protein